MSFIEIKCDNDKLIDAINKIKNYPLIVKTGYNNILNEL